MTDIVTQRIELRINCEQVSAAVEPRTSLADFLREQQMLCGTNIGCEQGVCGACTLMVDGMPTRSCITSAVVVLRVPTCRASKASTTTTS